MKLENFTKISFKTILKLVFRLKIKRFNKKTLFKLKF